MNIFTVSFFGHRVVENYLMLEKQVQEIVVELLSKKEYVEFLVGRNGEFDQMVSSVIRKCKRNIRDDNSALVCIMPYHTAQLRDNETAFFNYYDEIEVYNNLKKQHYKSAFRSRNRSMVDRSDLVVFYVEREIGGAYQTLRYAQQKGKKILNLCDIP